MFPRSQLAGEVKMFLPSFCLLIYWIVDIQVFVSFDAALALKSWISLVINPGKYHISFTPPASYNQLLSKTVAPTPPLWKYLYMPSICLLLFARILKTPAPYSGTGTILHQAQTFLVSIESAVACHHWLLAWVIYLYPIVHSGNLM